jgi:tRNA 2-thiouridine synthesizing protein A
MSPYAIERDPLLADERPDTLAKRVEMVLQSLAAATGSKCVQCSATVCAHDALASLVLGFRSEPRCTRCLAQELARDVSALRGQLTGYVLSKECLTVGWRWAEARESECAWAETLSGPPNDTGRSGTASVLPRSSVAPAHDADWDAGDLACGELVLELRRRLRTMAPGNIIRIRALDPAAPEDMPAWCRLTGHTLVHASPPDYFIRRKED